MKKFFSNFKKIFAFLLIIPMMFVFASCKKKNDNPNNPPTSSEQPAGGDDSSGGGDSSSGDEGDAGDGGSGGSGTESPEPEPEIDTFNLVVDYKLPDYLNGVLENSSLTPAVEDGYTLPVFTGTEYEDYFDGWYTSADYAENSKVENAKVFAEKDDNLIIYAKWVRSDLIEESFCTAGVQFSIDKTETFASPVSYEGTSEIVIISKKVKIDGKTYYVENNIVANCFKDNEYIKEFRTSLADFSVESNAFDNSPLETIDFSKILSAGNYAFKDTNVKNAVFSNKLNSLSSAVFYGCEKLELVDFRNVLDINVSAVPVDLCMGCTKLSSVDLSAKMLTIKESAFEGCSSLENLEFLKNSSVTSIEKRAFANCANLKNVEVISQIVSYGTGVFSGSNVENMTIYNMFYDSSCADFSFSTRFGNLSSTLKSVTFAGTNITKIYKNYFKNYTALETVIMNNQIEEIGNNAFDGCSNLKNITFSTALYGDKLNISTLSSTKWYQDIETDLQANSLNSKVVNNTLVYVSSSVSGTFVVSDDVEYIVADIFGANKNITSVTISKNVKKINKYAFYNSKVTSIFVNAENENYAVQTGTHEKFINVEPGSDITINYSALYELDTHGNKSTLISYVADKSGGLLIIPETVSLVYNSAFNSNAMPYYVYLDKTGAKVNITKKEYAVEYGPAGGYLFGDASISTTGSNANCTVYKFLDNAEEYDFSYDEENGYNGFNFTGLSGIYFAIVEEADLTSENITYQYYLINADSQQITDLSNLF